MENKGTSAGSPLSLGAFAGNMDIASFLPSTSREELLNITQWKAKPGPVRITPLE